MKFRFYYSPKRATVAMLCAVLKIQRRHFYRWRTGLLAAEKLALAAAMSGKMFSQEGEPIADAPLNADAAEDFDFDEIDRRLGWAERCA